MQVVVFQVPEGVDGRGLLMLNHRCGINELLYFTIERDLHCMISEGEQPVNLLVSLFGQLVQLGTCMFVYVCLSL